MEVNTIVLPADTNAHGNIFGGRVMEIIDKAAAIAAVRHCRCPIVTASVDSLDFIHPVKLGDILQVLAQVNAVWTTSMEVGVKVFSEQPSTGARTLTCTAYVTMVALGDNGRPARGLVPPLVARTTVEKRRQHEAETRRRRRLEHVGTAGGDRGREHRRR